MNTTALTFNVPEYQIEHSDGRYRDAIPVPAEELPLDDGVQWFREQNNCTTPDAAADAAALLLRQIGDRAQDTHIITGESCAVDPEYVWSAAADAEHRIREHYPWADMQEYLVLPYDTRSDEIMVLCGECSAWITNGERPDEKNYAAALDAVDCDVRAAERAPLAPRLRMHYGMIEAEHTGGVCECCDCNLYDAPDDGRANIWAY